MNESLALLQMLKSVPDLDHIISVVKTQCKGCRIHQIAVLPVLYSMFLAVDMEMFLNHRVSDKGVPQVQVLGPLLFPNPLMFRTIHTVSAYADDTSVYSRYVSISKTCFLCM